jgi:zinc/manganese transport system permease protein
VSALPIGALDLDSLELIRQPFVYHGLIVGSAVAILCGLVGFFTVLRGQVFAGDALSHVSYTGAVAALAAGVDLRFGLFAATLAVGGILAAIGGRWIADDVVIGVTFAWILGLGVLFVSLYNASDRGGDGSATTSVLFGSIYGISTSATVTAVAVAAGLLAVLLVVGRPLLFASVDPVVAAARGIPVRLLNTVFLIVVAGAAAEITQVVGAILLLGLLAAPAGAACRLTSRPWRAVALSILIALAAVWIGVAVSLVAARIPVSFAIIATVALAYGLAVLRGHPSPRDESSISAS